MTTDDWLRELLSPSRRMTSEEKLARQELAHFLEPFKRGDATPEQKLAQEVAFEQAVFTHMHGDEYERLDKDLLEGRITLDTAPAWYRWANSWGPLPTEPQELAAYYEQWKKKRQEFERS